MSLWHQARPFKVISGYCILNSFGRKAHISGEYEQQKQDNHKSWMYQDDWCFVAQRGFLKDCQQGPESEFWRRVKTRSTQCTEYSKGPSNGKSTVIVQLRIPLCSLAFASLSVAECGGRLNMNVAPKLYWEVGESNFWAGKTLEI